MTELSGLQRCERREEERKVCSYCSVVALAMGRGRGGVWLSAGSAVLREGEIGEEKV